MHQLFIDSRKFMILIGGGVLFNIIIEFGIPGHAVAQLVEAVRYKPEGRGFDSRWCQWNFSLT